MNTLQYYISCVDLEKARLFGKGYVIEYCIALFKQNEERKIFEMYVCEGIKILTENTARYAGGSVMNKSYFDILKPQESRTGDEIADEVIAKCGLKEVV